MQQIINFINLSMPKSLTLFFLNIYTTPAHIILIAKDKEIHLQYTYDTKELERVVDEIRHMLNMHPDIMNDQKIKYLIKMKKTYEDGIFNLSNHPGSGVGSKLLVYLDKIDNYSMNILVYAFSTSINWEEWLKVKQEILKEIIVIIDNSTLELAIPQEEIHLKNDVD